MARSPNDTEWKPLLSAEGHRERAIIWRELGNEQLALEHETCARMIEKKIARETRH